MVHTTRLASYGPVFVVATHLTIVLAVVVFIFVVIVVVVIVVVAIVNAVNNC